MEKYFSKKLIFLLTIVASFVIICISSIQFYLEFREYNIQSEREIKRRVERIASSVLPSVWELYQSSVERKFSDDFSSKVLDSEINSEGVDAIVIRGQFGHFYMGRYKDFLDDGSLSVKPFKNLVDYQNRFKENIYSFPIKNGSMTIGSVEVVRNDYTFKKEFRHKILINIVETVVITILFFLLTFYGISKSLLKPLQEISLSTKTINILNEGVFFLHDDFTIKDTNKAALEMLRTTKEKILGANGLSLFDMDNMSILKSMDSHDFVETEAYIDINNEKYYFQIYIVKIFDENNIFLNYALKFQDVTDFKNIMESLQAAKIEAEDANTRKSSFLANMSHEIRTPLNSICGVSSYIIDNIDMESNELVENLKSINFSSTHLLSVVNSIIDFSKIENAKIVLEKHDFSISEKMQELLSTFKIEADKKGVLLIFEDSLNGKIFKSDSYRLTQIVINLLSNSLKFTSKGYVKLSLSSLNNGTSYEDILVQVSDSGIGVPKQAQSTLFDAYIQADDSTTRNYGGTGLGLSISKELARLFKGEISFSENPDGGSIFKFKFPAEVSKELSPTAVVNSNSGPNLEGLNVLIVDDEKLNRRLLQLYFKKEKDVEIEVAFNGQEALDRFKDLRPDIVLLDLHMPVMDGHEALKQMREYEKRMGLKRSIIFMISANTLPESSKMLKESGADTYLLKPISSKDLKRELSKFINRV